MAYVLLCIAISCITGFLLSYLLAARYSVFERLTYGTVCGSGLFTWIAYLLSLIWGLQFKSIYVSILLLLAFCAGLLITRWSSLKEKIIREAREIKDDFLHNKVSYYAHVAVFSFFTTIFFRFFYRTILWKKEGMFVGLTNNYGDLPLHLAYITSFVWGNNIPPQDPSYAGEKLVYPFLSDFLSAIFLKLGLDFRDMVFIPGFLLTVVLYGVLYYFTYRLTKKRIAAIVSPFIFFFSGGFGVFYFFQDVANAHQGIWQFLMHLPRDYTNVESGGYRWWITPLTCLNVPQRAFLFGFPLTMLVFSLLYTGIERKEAFPGKWGGWNEFLFAGVLAGALPFFHTHSFLAMLMVTLPLGVIFWDWRRWFMFFMPAFLLSLPQVVYFSGHIGGGSFFKPNFGWMTGKDNFLWFWLRNLGPFWPAVIGGFTIIFVRANGRLPLRTGFFSLPFLILFVLPNLVLFAPWDWDNIKILIYWFLGTIPVAAFALSWLYENSRFKILSRTGFFIILFFLTAAGALDVFRYAIAPFNGWSEFSKEEMELARRLSTETPANAIFLNAPIHNHLVYLTGRKSLMGFPGHVWSHGYSDAFKREEDVKKMIRGKSETISLLETYKPHYVTLGPHEKRLGANKPFFDANFECIASTQNYKVYDLNRKKQETVVSTAPLRNFQQKKGTHRHGLTARYYDNDHWAGEPVYEDVDANLRFNFPDDNSKPLFSPFSVLWEGYLDIPNHGTYTFKLSSDDGSWLYLDDSLVIDNGGLHGTQSVSGSVVLEAGHHKILVKYFDGGGGAVFDLLWTPPDGKEEAIPEERLLMKR